MNEQDPAAGVDCFLSNLPKKGRKGCKVCRHAKHKDIEAAVVHLEKLKAEGKTMIAWSAFVQGYIQPTFGDLSRLSLKSHMEKCHGTQIT